MLLELLVGLSLQTKSENGTWYDTAYGSTRFAQLSYSAGIGVRGENWSVQFQDMGHEYSHYVDQNGVHWDGKQHPRGLYGIWEPHLTKGLYGQLGVGVDKPDFSMQANQAAVAANAHYAPSYLVGAGVNVAEHIDLLLSGRYIYTPVKGAESTNNFPNLGKFDYSLQVRWSF